MAPKAKVYVIKPEFGINSKVIVTYSTWGQKTRDAGVVVAMKYDESEKSFYYKVELWAYLFPKHWVHQNDVITINNTFAQQDVLRQGGRLTEFEKR